jgi:predicted ATPase
MAKIFKVEILNFRGIQSLIWFPAPGVNCLIGRGDSGKSTILDAIDLCLGARRYAQFSDVDFHALDVTKPIKISITLFDLDAPLKNMESYGVFLRSINPATRDIEEEPHKDWPTALTIQLIVEGDLEPIWSLTSAQAESLGTSRHLSWKDRGLVAPTRLGGYSNSNLSWTRGSVLNKLTDERAEVGAALIEAARLARSSFGDHAQDQLGDTLKLVTQTAIGLGIPVGTSARALLDTHATPFNDGAISLHSQQGIPLRSLGTGSSRLLVAGLQKMAAKSASILLVDEVEFGLEPHRLVRLLDSLGAKDTNSLLQVFLTTHSPVALRELSGDQLFIVRGGNPIHLLSPVGNDDDVQSTIRSEPEAFLSRSVIVCEGASEVGLIRGLDLYWAEQGKPPLASAGVSFVDTGGSDPDRCFHRGNALLRLGYRVLVVVDSDKPPTEALVASFLAAGGTMIAWQSGRALEDELFLSLPPVAIAPLLEMANNFMEEGRIDEHIKTASNGSYTLAGIETEALLSGYSPEVLAALGRASRTRKAGWYKSISKMQNVGQFIVGPHLGNSTPAFQLAISTLFVWAHAES